MLAPVQGQLLGQNTSDEPTVKQKILLIVVTSNRGLCGAFNANIIKTAIKRMNETYSLELNAGQLELFCIGKKSSDFFQKRGYPMKQFDNQIIDSLTFTRAAEIAQSLIQEFTNGTYKKIEVVYNYFKNAATQQVVVEDFLPLIIPQKTDNIVADENKYLLEPSKEHILDVILPKSLKIQFYKILLDSLASEHGARMTAMNKATDNASELLKELKLSYNKARQAAITTEIIEIVSGAEVLKGA